MHEITSTLTTLQPVIRPSEKQPFGFELLPLGARPTVETTAETVSETIRPYVEADRWNAQN